MASVVLLYGAGSGALHAVTGPDHVLSLGPAALQRSRAPWKIGLFWGAGHALGTLLLAIPALLAAELVQLEQLAAVGQRAAGLALMAMAVWSWLTLRRSAGTGRPDARSPLLVGLVHGASGAGSLLLVLPVLASGSLERTLLFLAAFAVGSTASMAGLTSLIARLGTKLKAATLTRVQVILTHASFAFGCFLLAFG